MKFSVEKDGQDDFSEKLVFTFKKSISDKIQINNLYILVTLYLAESTKTSPSKSVFPVTIIMVIL
jgi:hypothetical protein